MATGGASQATTERFRRRDARAPQGLELEPDAPASIFGIGNLFALKHDVEAAFEWLQRAKATRRWDMSVLETTPDFDVIKNDARFAKLLPSPDDFKNPFVEPVTILREWDGESMNDQFGWIARNIGDVDRDGVPDIVTSAPTSSAGGSQAGRVYVYSTRTGKLLWNVDGHADDQLGIGLEGAGDTNGDGIPDVIASAPEAAVAYVYSGSDGRVLLTLKAEHEVGSVRPACVRRRRRRRRWPSRRPGRRSRKQRERQRRRARLSSTPARTVASC